MPKKRERGKLPEETSQVDIWGENAPAITLIQHRYERCGMQHWNNERVSKLARDLGVTVWVLCAQAGMFEIYYDGPKDLFRLRLDKKVIRRAWRANHWPVLAAVNFERMESYSRAKSNVGSGLFLGRADLASIKILKGKMSANG